MLTFFAFIIVFGLLVFVHELGHFLAARKMGVRVEEFAFGFPPRIWGKKKGDTLYSINLIPLGGFVRMFGEHGEGESDKESYSSKTKMQKIVILISGVAMNFLLTVVLLTVLFTIGFQANTSGVNLDASYIRSDQRVEITEIEKGTPAFSELKKKDIIKKIEDKEIIYHAEVFAKVNELTRSDLEKNIDVTIIRDGKEEQKSLKTYETEIESKNKKVKVRRLGIVVETVGSTKIPFYLAPFIAVINSFSLAFYTLKMILQFFSQILLSFSLDENVVGPIGIAMMSGWSFRAGLIIFLQFVSMFSMSLAVINILPIPALDGGHIFTLLVEKIRGKDFSHEGKNGIQLIGLVLLFLLMIVITARDFANFGALQYLKGLVGI